MKNICGVITLYNPRSLYVSNIATYISYLNKLYVIDNSPETNFSIHAELKANFPKVEILSYGYNLGIAGALNLGITKALSDNYLWLLTMDQDSFFEKEQAEKYFSSFNVIEQNKTIIISPAHKKVPFFGAVPFYDKKDEVMTSGNLINLILSRQVGFFNENLFIDSVDHDYCLRANLMGFDVLQSTNVFINHTVGDMFNGSMFFGLKKKQIQIHSPKRMYFIVRNGLYIRNVYGHSFPKYVKMLKNANKQRISRCFRYSNQRLKYIYFVYKAYNDYYKNKFGNIVDL